MRLFLNNTVSIHLPTRGEHKGGDGFTLLEILVAVAILSIVLAAIYSTFFLSHRALEGMDESLIRLQESRNAVDILRRELDAACFSGKDSGTFLQLRDRDFHGKQTAHLDFTSFSVLRPGLSRISYYVEERDGRLTLMKKVEAPNSRDKVEGVDIIEGLDEFTVEAKYNNTWVKTWDTELNQGVPGEIRISLAVMIKGRTITLSDMSRPMYGGAL